MPDLHVDGRGEVEAWLDANWDPDLALADWWARLGASGWAVPSWPAPFGKGLSVGDANRAVRVFYERGVPGPPAGLGLWLAGPTLLAHGTEAQQERFLPPILDGTEAWCQLFSEPGAGSDLAGVSTRADRDGDGWRVTGQKVWTSGGHHADWGMLLARTDVDVPKHRGITYFLVAMDQAGVEVRPLRQLTGQTHFNEVFLDGARVDAGDVLGGLGGGWAVAQTTLLHERGTSGRNAAAGAAGRKAAFLDRRAGDLRPGAAQHAAIAEAGALLGATDELIRLACERGINRDPNVRQVLARVYTDSRLFGFAGPRSSTLKLAMSEAARRLRHAAFAVLGAGGMLEGRLQEQALASLALSIAGGTDEIQRTILGERVLGLPREPWNDNDLPFRERLH